MEDDLLKLLWSSTQKVSFATGDEIKHKTLKSMEISSLGKLQLPLSEDDILQLLGLHLMPNSVVTFPDNSDFLTEFIPKLAAEAMPCLGMPRYKGFLDLDVKVSTMKIGHGKLSRRDNGLFATMIVQLPTQTGNKGGAATIRNGEDCRKFDVSQDSDSALFYIVFYHDCECEVEPPTEGSMIFLRFDIFRRSQPCSLAITFMQYSEAVFGANKDVLKTWTQEFQEKKLAIELRHRYSKEELSFPGLRGKDRVAATILTNCLELDVYLGILSKETDGQFCVSNWISSTDKPDNWSSTSGVFEEEEVLRIERDKPDLLEPSETNGRHVAVLVAWPRKPSADSECLELEELEVKEDDDTRAPGAWNLFYEIICRLCN